MLLCFHLGRVSRALLSSSVCVVCGLWCFSLRRRDMSKAQRQIAAGLNEHIRCLSTRRSLDNRDGFDDEMDELNKVDHRVGTNLDEFYTASLATNSAKNRFIEVRANESTLVQISPLRKDEGEAYINANYVDGRKLFGVPFTYIATQAPLQNTVFDFWRMILENDVGFIVMLCGEIEDGKVKSEMYWPRKGKELDFGVLRVRLLSESRVFDLVFRTLVIHTPRGDERQVLHLQYVGWPDQGIPETSAPLMEIIQTMGKSECSVQAPIVVHCSGGIGRTGVFIAMHVALAQFQLERKDIDIKEIVHALRLSRSGMVQRKDQYIFLYYSALREMDRMILSAEKGINLLRLRRREMAPGGVGSGGPHVIEPAAPLPQAPLTEPPSFPPPVHTDHAYARAPPQAQEGNSRTQGAYLYGRTRAAGMTGAEEQMLERYRQQQQRQQQRTIAMQRAATSHSHGPRQHQPPAEDFARPDEPGHENNDGLLFSPRDDAKLEEQLRQWRQKNRSKRFSTGGRDGAGPRRAAVAPRVSQSPSPVESLATERGRPRDGQSPPEHQRA
ncbi:putative tyrosine specific protein phosphatase, partial [Trypanosoma grayi]|uniref:putative tyrosine specific protein phosphatase n=1 Tax=Trypanosoma grayi TaxID=71804 RepID=UPI0004F4692A